MFHIRRSVLGAVKKARGINVFIIRTHLTWVEDMPTSTRPLPGLTYSDVVLFDEAHAVDVASAAIPRGERIAGMPAYKYHNDVVRTAYAQAAHLLNAHYHLTMLGGSAEAMDQLHRADAEYQAALGVARDAARPLLDRGRAIQQEALAQSEERQEEKVRVRALKAAEKSRVAARSLDR